MRKLLKVLGGIGLLVIVVTVIASHMNSSPDEAVVPNSPAQPGTAKPSTPGKPNQPGKNQTASEQAAVTAAAQALDSLSVAPFLPKAEMKRLTRAVAVARKTSQLIKTFAYSGPLLATKLGYPTTNDARYRANYFVATRKYRVERYTGKTAIISLYTESHFVSSQNQRYLVPSISVVRMELRAGKWRYVSSSNPPAGQAPKPQRYQSYVQTVASYQPYLKGYSSYAQNR